MSNNTSQCKRSSFYAENSVIVISTPMLVVNVSDQNSVEQIVGISKKHMKFLDSIFNENTNNIPLTMIDLSIIKNKIDGTVKPICKSVYLVSELDRIRIIRAIIYKLGIHNTHKKLYIYILDNWTVESASRLVNYINSMKMNGIEDFSIYFSREQNCISSLTVNNIYNMYKTIELNLNPAITTIIRISK